MPSLDGPMCIHHFLVEGRDQDKIQRQDQGGSVPTQCQPCTSSNKPATKGAKKLFSQSTNIYHPIYPPRSCAKKISGMQISGKTSVGPTKNPYIHRVAAQAGYLLIHAVHSLIATLPSRQRIMMGRLPNVKASGCQIKFDQRASKNKKLVLLTRCPMVMPVSLEMGSSTEYTAVSPTPVTNT